MRRIRRLATALLILASFAIGWSAPVVSVTSTASTASHLASVHRYPDCAGGGVPC